MTCEPSTGGLPSGDRRYNCALSNGRSELQATGPDRPGPQAQLGQRTRDRRICTQLPSKVINDARYEVGSLSKLLPSVRRLPGRI